MKSIRPDVIYIQQSGMGVHGTYGRMRTVGPVAAAFGGQGDMSGLPEPAMPVGWGYSFLDWMGAYGYALALLGALYHRERTGEGQWIDASQCESGSVPDRCYNSRLVGQRARLATLRQSLALQAGGAAWCVSLRGEGSLDRHRLLHRYRVGAHWRRLQGRGRGWTIANSTRWNTDCCTRIR